MNIRLISKLLILVTSTIAFGSCTHTKLGSQNKKPQFGKWGVDLEHMDKSVAPGDDFYEYVNGKWQQTVKIDDDKMQAGSMADLQEFAFKNIKQMISDIAKADHKVGSEAQKIKDWYLTLNNEEALSIQGLKPIQLDLDKIEKIKTRQDLQDMIAQNNHGVGVAPIIFEADFHAKKKQSFILILAAHGMSLPAREIYLEKNYKPVREMYLQHLTRAFKLMEFSNPGKRAENTLKLETEIAKVTWPLEKLRDPIARFNVTKTSQLKKIFPELNWDRFLEKAELPKTQYINITTKSTIRGVAKLIKYTPIDEWKDYFRYHLLLNTHVVLAKQYRDEIFSFHGKVLAGQPKPKERYIDIVMDMGWMGKPMVDALGKEYVKRYVPEESRPQLRKIVEYLMKAFDDRLEKLTWMTPETKKGAREKLANTKIKVIYPDYWFNIDGLNIVNGDAVGNMKRSIAFMHERNLSQLTKSPDRRAFLKHIYEVNAYANPSWNEIVFLAGIVRPPFFDPYADPAVNYGAIGAVIGHEISHLFDDQGRKYDKDGLLNDWWTKKDAKKFNKVGDRLVKQMETYEVLPGKHMNGKLTLGESIADVAGLTVALEAYKLSLQGKEAPILDGYTGLQRFFLSYTQMWRWKGRDAYVDQLLKRDPHPTTNFRPYTVRNINDWYNAFDVKSDNKLYLPKKERVQIW